jgi:hypothetical protein
MFLRCTPSKKGSPPLPLPRELSNFGDLGIEMPREKVKAELLASKIKLVIEPFSHVLK